MIYLAEIIRSGLEWVLRASVPLDAGSAFWANHAFYKIEPQKVRVNGLLDLVKVWCFPNRLLPADL